MLSESWQCGEALADNSEKWRDIEKLIWLITKSTFTRGGTFGWFNMSFTLEKLICKSLSRLHNFLLDVLSKQFEWDTVSNLNEWLKKEEEEITF